ncbi:DUF6293 family protein [Candidatus Scalindua japonica]|uniref:HFX_2341 family transcriptional regulator domain-containing protein n=1 Tax=Candidatus Scalindua japonica TaxID=1284222 RepID=UPI0013A54B35|nr:DUF6293 family protein [Candidatus Scalindua japonica]
MKLERIVSPKDKLNFYFTNNNEENKVTADSIFKKTYNKLTEKLLGNIQKKYKTHILLVGFSIQPIILSIFALKAQRVILLFSKDSKDKCYEITYWCKKISSDLSDCSNDIEFFDEDNWHDDNYKLKVDSSEPSDTCKKIYSIIASENQRGIQTTEIAVDITGGKKPMVSGAYIACGIKNLDSFYIDCETYVNDKPVPGTEFIKKLVNPTEINKIIEQLKKNEITKDEIPENFKRYIPMDLRESR